MGHAVVQLIEALCYKLECRRFESRWCHSSFHWLNPSSCTTDLRMTHPLTEMSAVGISKVVKVAGA